MTRRKKFETFIPELSQWFEEKKRAVFVRKDLESLCQDISKNHMFPQNMSVTRFINYLVESSPLQRVVLEFPSRNIHRYVWGSLSVYQVAQSLDEKSYFSHATALYLHGLIKDAPNEIFLNLEQSIKPPPAASVLEQSRIDQAFKGKPRVSNTKASIESWQLTLLSGKNTGNLGVGEMDVPQHGKLRVSEIERTLIDTTVRPFYSGGPAAILAAFRGVGKELSVEKLLSYLKKIDHVYPYQHAIGFYLETAQACSESDLKRVESTLTNLKFHLDYRIQSAEYSDRWRVYYPRGLR